MKNEEFSLLELNGSNALCAKNKEWFHLNTCVYAGRTQAMKWYVENYSLGSATTCRLIIVPGIIHSFHLVLTFFLINKIDLNQM